MINDHSFHHIGCATNDIIKEAEYFSALGYEIDSETFQDYTQGVRGCFLAGPGPRIELLENLENSSTLAPWLNSGIKFYHMAYLVENIDMTVDWFKKKRAVLTVPPIPAVAFNNRKIAFFMMRNRQLIEVIEKEQGAQNE